MSKIKLTGHGSGSGTLTIQAPDTDSARTITLPDSTGTILDENSSLPAANLTGTVADARISALTASKLTGALPAISGASLTGLPLVNPNLIINGAMKVAQRGTSFAAAANSTYPVDHFRFHNNAIGAYTISQDSTGPTGFANSIKIDCTTADASPSAADYLYLATLIEAQDLQHLKKGTASAESVTLSFWVKCNKTGNGQVNLRDMDNTRMIANTYTISVADTWEQKTITFAGDTTGAFGDNSDVGLNVDFWFDSGSDFSSGAVPTSWEATATADNNAGGTLDLADSTSNYINITGVKLEVGTSATDFVHRSYAEEFALCQRYWQQSYNDGVKAGTFAEAGLVYGWGAAGTATTGYLFGTCILPVQMRTQGTITIYDYDNPSNSGKVFRDHFGIGGSQNQTGASQAYINKWLVYSSSGNSANCLIFHYTIDAEL